jgi:hypothetical protein
VRRFEAAPAVVLAAVRQELQGELHKKNPNIEPEDYPLFGLFQQLGPGELALVVVARADCAKADLERRAYVLDLCRRWFTARLQRAVKGPVDLFIARDARHKR